MKGSYSQDLVLTLQDSLNSLSSNLITSTPRPSSPQGGISSTSIPSINLEEQATRISIIRSTLSALDNSKHHLSREKLTSLLDLSFPPFQALGSVEDGGEGENAMLLAKFTIAVIGILISELIREAGMLEEEDNYWSEVERDGWRTGMFLLQTTPSRMISVGSLAITRLRAITTSSLHSNVPSQSLFNLSTFQNALPNSLLLASVFPHLSTTLNSENAEESQSDFSLSAAKRISKRTRKLLLLPLSPLILTRQEVTKKRSEIQSLRTRLAKQIGTLTLSLSTSPYLGSTLSSASLSSNSLLTSTWSTLSLLERTLSPTSTTTMLSTPPTNPSDFALSLHHLLQSSLPSHITSYEVSFTSLRRPGYLTRRWPYLLSLPLVGIVLGRTLYNSRATLFKYLTTAQETVRGFLVDWVVEPVTKILQTVRHGDQTALALMGKESLRSDLDSLERMVVAFGKDQYGLSGDELTELADRVRAGDLTSVLRVWEEDIKSPIRSAVAGSLIRTLLIQVQKVKVDGALAMDGIEKMLRSQQLTFGFVGVAPSLIVLVALTQWVRSLFSGEGSKKNLKEVRLRNWSTMRHLDSILSPRSNTTSASTPDLESESATVQGYLILELNSLRSYAQSRYFPTNNTQLKEAFLDDVRELENSGTEAKWEVRRVLIQRLWRWSTALKWVEIL